MATSGTTAFNMDFTEIAEEAWERAGREMRSGYDLRTARRSMNLLTIEWQNRGINMWTIEEGTLNLAQGTATYNLPAVHYRLTRARSAHRGREYHYPV
jgi:hypothetical protein